MKEKHHSITNFYSHLWLFALSFLANSPFWTLDLHPRRKDFWELAVPSCSCTSTLTRERKQQSNGGPVEPAWGEVWETFVFPTQLLALGSDTGVPATLTLPWLSFVFAAPRCLGWLRSLPLEQFIWAELSQILFSQEGRSEFKLLLISLAVIRPTWGPLMDLSVYTMCRVRKRNGSKRSEKYREINRWREKLIWKKWWEWDSREDRLKFWQWKGPSV